MSTDQTDPFEAAAKAYNSVTGTRQFDGLEPAFRAAVAAGIAAELERLADVEFPVTYVVGPRLRRRAAELRGEA